MSARQLLADQLVAVHHAAAAGAVDLADALGTFQPLDLPAGEHLVEEGDSADFLYVLVEGELDVTHRGSPVATIRGPAVVGHLGVLVGLDRNATLTARDDVRVLQLQRDRMWRLLDGVSPPGVALRRLLLAAMSELLVHENEALAQVPAPGTAAPAPAPAPRRRRKAEVDPTWGFDRDLVAEAEQVRVVEDEASKRRKHDH